MTSIQSSIYLAGFAPPTTHTEPTGLLVESYAEFVTAAFNDGQRFEDLYESFCDGNALSDTQAYAIAEQTFRWLVEGFAVFVENLEADDVHIVDLDRAFDHFAARHGLSEHATDMLAEKITEAAGIEPDHHDDPITFPDEAGRLDQIARLAKIRLFLKSIARCIPSGAQPLFPDLRIGDKPDPYGNRAGGNMKTFDREKNRYGASPTPKSAGRGFNPLAESLQRPSPRSNNMERYVVGLKQLDRLWTTTSAGPMADFRAAARKTQRGE